MNHSSTNIPCIGGGPAGLYFGLLMKLQEPSRRVVVAEPAWTLHETAALQWPQVQWPRQYRAGRGQLCRAAGKLQLAIGAGSALAEAEARAHEAWVVDVFAGLSAREVDTLNRPDSTNPLTIDSCSELCQLFGGLRRSTEVKVVVLAGAGGNFCSGGDVHESRLEPASCNAGTGTSPVLLGVLGGPMLGGWRRSPSAGHQCLAVPALLEPAFDDLAAATVPAPLRHVLKMEQQFARLRLLLVVRDPDLGQALVRR